MTLLLTLEQGPRAQAMQQARLDEGELVIGRSATADWQIDDPEMYVSRAHCTVSARDDGYFVTDTSSSGLYIDDSNEPVGPGNSVRLRSGMRLRLGEYIIWADVRRSAEHSAEQPQFTSAPQGKQVDVDDFFSVRSEEAPKPPRPASLPDPFDFERPGRSSTTSLEDPDRPRSQAFDDPFSLDPLPTDRPDDDPRANSFDDFGNFGTSDSGFDGQKQPFTPPPPPDDWAVPPAVATPPEVGLPPPPPVPKSPPAAAPRPPAAAQAGHQDIDAALRAAFYRGLGLDPSELPPSDPAAEMEKFGREYRLMIEGLMQLLRKRAEEKGNARIAQTVVGASDVNPLKFLPTAEDVLTMIATGRSPGFLAGEPAIIDAVQDLAGHHVRAWRGVQTALRRMIDRFDPAAIEEELKSSSALDKLMSGGRSAKLWELYCKRHREISMNAESRFLGDVGADFRNAYEQE